MSKFVIDLNASPSGEAAGFGGFAEPVKRSRTKRIAVIMAMVILSILTPAGIGGYFYWQGLKATPQYSLALIVDAARRDDQPTIDELVDTDAVVDSFLPQITSKAVELYGRGMPPEAIARVSQIAAPVLPALKERARAELPGVIRRKTEKFASVPFAAMVFAGDRYLDVAVRGDDALVKSKLPEHSFEVEMKRVGNKWKIVDVHDDQLATRIAQKVGQDILGIAAKGGLNSVGDRLGIRNLNELLKSSGDLFR